MNIGGITVPNMEATPFSLEVISTTALSTPPDVESKPQEPIRKTYPQGYPSVGALLSSDPDLQVYRRFDRLATRNLLYLQAEICTLEARLDALDQEDMLLSAGISDEAMDLKLTSRCWEAMADRSSAGSPRAQARMDLILLIRTRLQEYQDALLRQSQVRNLENPNPRVRNVISNWFDTKRPLAGHGRNFYDDKRDLVALRTPPDQDRLSLFLQDHLGCAISKQRSENPIEWEGLSYFHEGSVERMVSFVSVIIAAGLLVGAICGLFFAPNDRTRLGLLSLFTTLFAASLGLLTNAKKVEVFAATAAYTAVLVVFVSGDFGNSNVGNS